MSSGSSGVVPDGLSADEAARRLRADGPNELPTSKPLSLLHQLGGVLREPMLVLLLAAGAINFLLAEPLDGGILMASVIVVIGISLYQAHKTEGALAALRDLSAPRALVVRDGTRSRIPGREVVRGDVILLAEGDRVAADARIVECTNFSVDESTLTGEAMPVRKAPTSAPSPGPPRPGGDDTPWVFSGTLVVHGRGVAVVEATGPSSELGRIGHALEAIRSERTPLQREIDRLVRVIAVIGVTAASIVFATYGSTRGEWLEAALAGIATAMSMLPEEFPVVLTVFLALGARRMSQRQVLARRPAVIEALGSATVVCVDKTGTLTLNSMTLRSLTVDDARHQLTADPLPQRFHRVLEVAALASPVDAFDPMDRAFRTAIDDFAPNARHPEWQLVHEYPLSEELLALSRVWRQPGDGRLVVAAKGAPEAIVDLCHLDDVQRRDVLDRVDSATRRGERVLGVACATLDGSRALPERQHDVDFEFVGLAGLHDPVRPGAAAAVAECARAGVRTVMITGDHPGTARAIAAEIALPPGDIMTGAELDQLSDDALDGRVGIVNIYARMVPEQKLRLVRALRRTGQVVAMTGDGVNDAPALRAADIGIAMGGRGTDVAREAAALVITDDDISSIARGIRQGRSIYDNLRKAMSYIVAVHVSIVGMALFPLVSSEWPLVLLPVHLALLELVIDPACSIVFEAEEGDPSIMDQPPRPPRAPVLARRVLIVAVLQGVSSLLAVLGVYVWALMSGRSDDVVRTLTFTTITLSNLGLILVNRSWRLPVWRTFAQRRNPALAWILVPALGLLVALVSVPAARDALALGPIGLGDAAVAAGAAAVGLSWFEIDKLRRHGRPIEDDRLRPRW